MAIENFLIQRIEPMQTNYQGFTDAPQAKPTGAAVKTSSTTGVCRHAAQKHSCIPNLKEGEARSFSDE